MCYINQRFTYLNLLAYILLLIGYFSLTHVYSLLGTYRVQIRYAGDESPLTTSLVMVEESLTDLRLLGPTIISFVR